MCHVVVFGALGQQEPVGGGADLPAETTIEILESPGAGIRGRVQGPRCSLPIEPGSKSAFPSHTLPGWVLVRETVGPAHQDSTAIFATSHEPL